MYSWHVFITRLSLWRNHCVDSHPGTSSLSHCRGLGTVVQGQAHLLAHTLRNPDSWAPSETYWTQHLMVHVDDILKTSGIEDIFKCTLHELSGKSYKKKILGSLLTSHIWVQSLKMSSKQSHICERCFKIQKNFTYTNFFDFSKWCVISVSYEVNLGLVRLRTCPRPQARKLYSQNLFSAFFGPFPINFFYDSFFFCFLFY